ncbi:MAG: class I SAM-dependent methyltransferase, partial [Pseudomonadales bacterium]|nr:class I SAM-dependent methyltransferase [Pseudomonadales bacterium]
NHVRQHGAVAEWWRSNLKEIPADAVILEAGCGNCSMLPDMIRSNTGRRYIGVDLASISPSKVAEELLANHAVELTLHAETSVEQIPEPDESVNVYVSVFGVEYSDLGRSLPEAFRILRPEGCFRALLHHDESVVTTMSRRALAEFNEEDITHVIEALSTISKEREKALSLSELKANPKAEKRRKRINSLAEKDLSNTDPDTANATMFEVMNDALKFFRMMNENRKARDQFITSLEEEHRASHERFRQMVSVAMNHAEIEDVESLLDQAGFRNVRSNIIHNNDDILAWELCAEK